MKTSMSVGQSRVLIIPQHHQEGLLTKSKSFKISYFEQVILASLKNVIQEIVKYLNA